MAVETSVVIRFPRDGSGKVRVELQQAAQYPADVTRLGYSTISQATPEYPIPQTLAAALTALGQCQPDGPGQVASMRDKEKATVVWSIPIGT